MVFLVGLPIFIIMIGIYKITSPTDKVYIGQSVDIDKRIKKYKWISSTSKQPQVFRSIQKYGWEKHKVEVIEECEIGELDKREAFWKQRILDEIGWENVLFCKIHDCVQNKPLPQSIKNKISESKTGSKLSPITIQRMVDSRIRGKHCKPAYQYDLDGNFIKKWKYREDAEVHFSGGNKSNITSCINGKQKTAYGFVWSREKIDKYKPSLPHQKTIYQYNNNMKLIKTWNNLSEAERYYNPKSFEKNKYGSNNIRACINGKQKIAYKYIWSTTLLS